MTLITEGLTSSQFISFLNGNLPSKDILTASQLTGELITKFHSNYDYVKSIDTELANRPTLTIGMTGAAYIAALNSCFNNYSNSISFDEIDYDIPDNAGSEYNMMADSNHGPSVLALSGNTIMSCMRRGGVGFSRENFSVVMDSNGNCSEPNLVGYDETSDGTFDSHGKLSIIEKDGIIYGFHEVYRGVGNTKNGPHNSDIIVIKSIDGGNTWIEVTRILGYHSYPEASIIGDDIYLIARSAADVTFNPFYISLWKSSDECETWTALSSPYLAASGQYVYKGIIQNGDEINLIIVDRITSGDGTFACYPNVFHIRSTDGITYYNNAKTWSKNVQTQGQITRAEAISNCLIGIYTSDTYSAHWHGSFFKNNKLYTLISYGQCGTATQDAGLGMWKAIYDSCKLYEDTTEIADLSILIDGLTYEGYEARFLRMFRNGDYFDFLQTSSSDSNDVKLIKYSLSSGFISTKILKAGTDDSKYLQFGGATYGALTRENRVITILKLTGSWFDINNAYADLIIFKPR